VSQMPLRWRLPLISIAILLVAEILLGAAAIGIVRHSLTVQIDARLTDAVTQVAARPGQLGPEMMNGGAGAVRSLPSDYLVFLYGPNGSPLTAVNEATNGATAPTLSPPLDRRNPVTVRDDTGERWRVITLPLRAERGTVSVALPLKDVAAADAALRRTLGMLAVATAAIGATAAWWATRRSLRPLAAVEETAGRVAAGDLTQRVPGEDAPTEAGSVAASINRMIEQLQQAFESQRAADARLRRFVSDASHELRTPLTAIRGYAEFHRTGAQEPDDAMLRIEANATRMGGLVEDLLLLARSDEAAQVLAGDEHVDMAAVCEDAAADARVQDATRSVTVTATGDPTVIGSDRHLRQVIGNLVANALLHTPTGTPIELDTKTVGDAVVTTVRDHGQGIDDAELERVFDRFHRLDESRTRSTGGSGLGLSIVAAIVAAHSGEVRAFAPPGEGVAIEVTLPTRSGRALAQWAFR